MANSASDARAQRARDPPQADRGAAVDVMVAIGPNFFYTVTLPCHALVPRPRQARTPTRADQVLFIDARQIFRQIDRAHREFTAEQIEFLANIVRLYRGEKPEIDARLRTRSSPSDSPTAPTPTSRASARSRRSTRSRRRGGASTPAATWAPRSRTSTTRSSRRSSPPRTLSSGSLAATAETLEQGVDAVLSNLLSRLTRRLDRE